MVIMLTIVGEDVRDKRALKSKCNVPVLFTVLDMQHTLVIILLSGIVSPETMATLPFELERQYGSKHARATCG